MGRRSFTHDYARPGFYHITLRAEEPGRHPFGSLAGRLDATPGDADAPRVLLTPVGRMVEEQLSGAITRYYPMAFVREHVVMPDHLHFILQVVAPLVSASGRSTHVGQLIAGFKLGCNRRYWAMMEGLPAEPAAALAARPATAPVAPSVPAATVPSVRPATAPVAPSATAAGGSAARRPSLFAEGYVDVMPFDAAQLATQRAYILDNPRSRLLRSTFPDRLYARRGGIDTALTVAALRGYLQRECPPSVATPEALAHLERRLLLTTHEAPPAEPAGAMAPVTGAMAPVTGAVAPMPGAMTPVTGTVAASFICCDSYGDRVLLTAGPLLPVVCHRRDRGRFALQKARCLDAAAAGAILVSPRIAPGEQTVIDEAANSGFPVVLIVDNGFGERYHPSADRLGRCAAGRLLLVTPWQYAYRGKDDPITVLCCKTMNCVAQALCRRRDNWWQR